MKIGFRQWGMGSGHLWPAGYATGVPWDLAGPTRFRCAAKVHCRPAFGCQCGLYVRPRLTDVDRRTNNGRLELVVGVVQAWGGYVVHGDEFLTEGARYEVALPIAFLKPSTVLAQTELQLIAERLGAVILADREALQEWANEAGPLLEDKPAAPWWERL